MRDPNTKDETKALLFGLDLSKPFAVQKAVRKAWESFFVGLALSVVMGFAVAIASAQAIQSSRFSDKHPSECRSIAVAQAITAVHDLNDFALNKSALSGLIITALNDERPHVTEIPKDPDGALQYAFYRQYDVTIGDCLAEATFKSLWWIGVPSFLLTMVWWYWKYIRVRRSDAEPVDQDNPRQLLLMLALKRQNKPRQQSAC